MGGSSSGDVVGALAQALVGGAHEVALARCEGDPELAAAVSRAAASLLFERATSHRVALPADVAVWPRAQDGFVALAALPGVDAERIANALFEASALEPMSGQGDDISQTALALMLEHIPDRVAALIDTTNAQWFERRQLHTALWGLPGAEGAKWLMRLVSRDDTFSSFHFQDMCTGKIANWAPDDWAARLNALSDAKLTPRPAMLQVFGVARGVIPRESAAAQVRLACTYAEDATDYLLRTIAGYIRGYRTGDPERDLELFWWQPDPDQRELLAWVMELSGAAGEREALVGAASAAGLVDQETRVALAAPFERPAWADGEVPWEVDAVVDAGVVRTPDGRVAGGDPWWSFEGLPFEVQLPPGAYPVRVVVARHPLYAPANAAAELIADGAAEPTRWQLVETTYPHSQGYWSEVGVGSFGAVKALCPGLGEALPEDVFGSKAATREVDGGEAGTLVLFTIWGQHQDCRTWAGVDADGRVVRLVTDLGLLGLEPTTRALPW